MNLRNKNTFTPFKEGRTVLYNGEPHIIVAVTVFAVDEIYLAIEKPNNRPNFMSVNANDVDVIPSMY